MTTRMAENAARRAQVRGQSWPEGARVFVVGLALTLAVVWWVHCRSC